MDVHACTNHRRAATVAVKAFFSLMGVAYALVLAAFVW